MQTMKWSCIIPMPINLYSGTFISQWKETPTVECSCHSKCYPPELLKTSFFLFFESSMLFQNSSCEGDKLKFEAKWFNHPQRQIASEHKLFFQEGRPEKCDVCSEGSDTHKKEDEGVANKAHEWRIVLDTKIHAEGEHMKPISIWYKEERENQWGWST